MNMHAKMCKGVEVINKYMKNLVNKGANENNVLSY